MNPPEEGEMEKSNNQLAEEQPLEEKATERLSHGQRSHQSAGDRHKVTQPCRPPAMGSWRCLAGS